MRKASSKSHITPHQHPSVPDSRKGSRLVKANSCIKVNSLTTEQQSNSNVTHNHLAKSSLPTQSHKIIAKMPVSLHLIDKPSQTLRQSSRKKVGKSSIETVPLDGQAEEVQRYRTINEVLLKQNAALKDRCCLLQETGVRDKEKIKNLIIRINEVKNSKNLIENSNSKSVHPSTAQLPHSSASYSHLPQRKTHTPFKMGGQCQNSECADRKRYLENELYRERIKGDKLEGERREWERSRELLKNQYQQLLGAIREIRSES